LLLLREIRLGTRPPTYSRARHGDGRDGKSSTVAHASVRMLGSGQRTSARIKRTGLNIRFPLVAIQRESARGNGPYWLCLNQLDAWCQCALDVRPGEIDSEGQYSLAGPDRVWIHRGARAGEFPKGRKNRRRCRQDRRQRPAS